MWFFQETGWFHLCFIYLSTELLIFFIILLKVRSFNLITYFRIKITIPLMFIASVVMALLKLSNLYFFSLFPLGLNKKSLAEEFIIFSKNQLLLSLIFFPADVLFSISLNSILIFIFSPFCLDCISIDITFHSAIKTTWKFILRSPLSFMCYSEMVA